MLRTKVKRMKMRKRKTIKKRKTRKIIISLQT